jgi:hypothetical protein
MLPLIANRKVRKFKISEKLWKSFKSTQYFENIGDPLAKKIIRRIWAKERIAGNQYSDIELEREFLKALA